MTRDLTPPAHRIEDTVWESFRIALSIGTAGIGTPILDAFIRSPRQARFEDWCEDVGPRIVQLEAQRGVKIEDLAASEQFVTTLTEASQAAMRTHNKTKREALRNAVLNSSLPGAPDEARQSIFIRLVDELTELHLRTLQVCSTRRYSPGQLQGFLLKGLRELDDSGLYTLITGELEARDLIRRDSPGGVTYLQGDELWATPFGLEFLAFIREPVTRAQA